MTQGAFRSAGRKKAAERELDNNPAFQAPPDPLSAVTDDGTTEYIGTLTHITADQIDVSTMYKKQMALGYRYSVITFFDSGRQQVDIKIPNLDGHKVGQIFAITIKEIQ